MKTLRKVAAFLLVALLMALVFPLSQIMAGPADPLSDAKVTYIISSENVNTGGLEQPEDFTYGPNDNIYLNMKIKYTTKSHYYDKIVIKVLVSGYYLNETVDLDGISYDTSTSVGINAAGQVVSPGDIVVGWLNTYTFYDVSPYDELIFTAVYKDDWSTKTAILHITDWIDDRPAAPAQPVLVYDLVVDNAVVTGVDSSMEYRLRNDSNWTPCTSNMLMAIPAKTQDYLVRYAATESITRPFKLKSAGSAPSCSYSTSTETITKVSDAMEVKYGSGAYVPIAPAATTLNISSAIDPIPTGQTLQVSVRSQASATDPASKDKVFTVNSRLAAPTTIVYNPVSISCTGVTSSMEYSVDNGATWKAVSGSTLNLEAAASSASNVDVGIRYKATTNNAASLPVIVTIAQLLPGPTGVINFADETITGLANGSYQYSTNGTSWSAITVSNGIIDVSGKISSSPVTYYLRKAATPTTPISGYTAFALPARPAAPSTPAFVYNDVNNPDKVVLTGIDNSMQYKKTSNGAWVDITTSTILFDPETSTNTYYVRIKADSQSFASANKNISMASKPTAPSCSYSTTTEMITSLSDAMEIRYNGGAYATVTTGVTTLDMSSLVNGLTTGQTMVINVRKKATATAPAGTDKVFTLYPRLAAPTTIAYNPVSISCTGVASSMEYSIDNGATWKAVSGTTLSLETAASPTNTVDVKIRYKATSSNAASLPAQFTIAQLLPGPTGTIDYANEAISSLANGNYQYGTNGTSWKAATVSNGSLDITDVIASSGKTLYLRKAATLTDPITHYTTFAIPARPSAPSGSAFVYNDANNPDKVVLTGVNSTMQYKKSTDSVWIDITTTTILFDPQSSSATYNLRIKASSQNFASATKNLSMAAKPSAPTCAYNSSTETITGLSTAMEISFDNGGYTAIASGTTYVLTGLIDLIPTGGSLVVDVRKKATSSAPASLVKTFTIYARPAKSPGMPQNPEKQELLEEMTDMGDIQDELLSEEMIDESAESTVGDPVEGVESELTDETE